MEDGRDGGEFGVWREMEIIQHGWERSTQEQGMVEEKSCWVDGKQFIRVLLSHIKDSILRTIKSHQVTLGSDLDLGKITLLAVWKIDWKQGDQLGDNCCNLGER